MEVGAVLLRDVGSEEQQTLGLRGEGLGVEVAQSFRDGCPEVTEDQASESL